MKEYVLPVKLPTPHFLQVSGNYVLLPYTYNTNITKINMVSAVATVRSLALVSDKCKCNNITLSQVSNCTNSNNATIYYISMYLKQHICKWEYSFYVNIVIHPSHIVSVMNRTTTVACRHTRTPALLHARTHTHSTQH